jgi:hypothetical protein
METKIDGSRKKGEIEHIHERLRPLDTKDWII